jgi:glucose-1-phosphate cytidylyltransferase
VKVAILAGGFGSRLSEETEIRPKPMVEIGGKPILWHIMKQYDHFGFREFVVALGYKGEHIKRYMVDYCAVASDLTLNLRTGSILNHGNENPDWQVELIDTGLYTNTGGRIRRLAPHVGNQTFMVTWGDGVADLDLRDLLTFHRSHGKLATLTAVRPPARFGRLELDGDTVAKFTEKPQIGEGWINGAFFVLEPGVFDYIESDDTLFEREPLESLSADGQLMAYKHDGFWQCMDTLRDKRLLNTLWETGKAPWQVWER